MDGIAFGTPSRVAVAALAAAFLTLQAAPASAAVELVTNGGFETGDLTPWTCTGAGDCRASELDGYSGNWAFNGFANTGVGILSQTITTVAGTSYDFSFFSRTGAPTNVLHYSIDGAAPVLVPSTIPYAQTSGSFTASGTSAAISFLFQTSTASWYIDDVSVVAAPAAIPLPATLPLAVGALALLGLLGFRRRGASAGL